MRYSLLVVSLALGVAATMPAQGTRFLEMKTLLGAPVRVANPDAVQPIDASAGGAGAASETEATGLGREIGVVVGIRLAGETSDRADHTVKTDAGAPVDLIVQTIREGLENERLVIPLAKADWNAQGAWLVVSLDDARELPATTSSQEQEAATAPSAQGDNPPAAPGQDAMVQSQQPGTLTADRLASAIVVTRDGVTPPVDGLVFDLHAGTLAYVLAEGTQKDITPSTPRVRYARGQILFGDRDAVVPWSRVEARTTGPGGPVTLSVPIDSEQLAEAPKMSLARSGKLEHAGFRERVVSWWNRATRPATDRSDRPSSPTDRESDR